MAGRSVGRIEVTVDADTSRLKAQLVRGSRQAGEAAQKTIEEQLKDLDATIDFNSAELKVETRRVREQIEAQLRGLAIEGSVEISVVQAKQKLRELEAFAEAQRLAIHTELSERDIGEINARLRTMTERRREIGIQFVADQKELERKLAELRVKEPKIKLLADLDTNLADQRLDKLAQERRQAHVLAVVELHRAEEALQAFEKQKFTVPFDVDTSPAVHSWEEFRAKVSAAKVDVTIGADMARARATLAELERGEIDVTVKAELTRARAAIDLFRELQQRNDIEIPVDLDIDALDAALTRFEAKLSSSGGGAATRAGKNSGGKFMGGFSSAIFDQQKLIAGAVTLLGSDIAQVLQGGLAAATSVVSSAFSGLAGGIGAAAPLIAGLIPAVSSVVVGFQGMGDALGAVGDEFKSATEEGRAFNINAEEIQAAMSHLAPAAQDVVKAFADMQGPLNAIQQQVQGALFEGLDSTLTRLSGTVIPDIGNALRRAASIVNDFFQRFATAAEGIDFSGLMRVIEPAVRDIGDAFISVFKAVEPFLRAATPAAKELAQSLKAGAESLLGMVQAGAQSGNLRDFLLEGVDSLRQWGDLLVAVGDALFTLFEAGKSSGDSFITSLTNIVTKFDTWMESAAGQTALQEFFESGRRTMKALVPVLEGLQGLFKNLVGPEAVSRFENLTDALGRALPFLGQILDLISRVGLISTFVELFARIGEALQPAIPALQALADAIGDSLLGVVEKITPILPELADAIAQLAVALTPVMVDLFDKFGDVLVALAPIVIDLANAIADLPTPLLEAGAAILVVNSALKGMVGINLAGLAVKIFGLGTATTAAGEAATAAAGPWKVLAKSIVDGIGGTATVGALAAFGLQLGVILQGSPQLRQTADGLEEVKVEGDGLGETLKNVATGKVFTPGFWDDTFGSVSPTLSKATAASDDLATSQENLAAAAEKVQAVLAAVQIQTAIADAIKLQSAIEGAAGGMAQFTSGQHNFSTAVQESAEALSNVRTQAEGAATAADKLREEWDLMTGGAVGVTEASINQAEAYAAVAEQLSKAQAGEEGYALTLDLSTEAGRENQQVLLDSANSTKEFTAAMVASGDASKESISKYRDQRNALLLQAEGFGLSKEEAQSYVTEGLGLIPPRRLMRFIQRGVKEAEGEVDGYKGKLDRLPSRKDSRVGAPGANEAKAQVGGLMTQIGKLKGKDAPVKATGAKGAAEEVGKVNREVDKVRGKDAPVKAPGATEAERQVKGVTTAVDKVRGKDAPIKAPGATEATRQVDGLHTAIGNLSSKTVNIAAAGAVTAEQQVRNLKSAIDQLQSKTITVTVNQVGKVPAGQHGGQAPYGGMLIGEAGPEFYRMGTTRGLASSPTLVPAGTMVDSAALSSALIRAQSPTGTVIQRQVILNQTVTPNSADPAAVAVQVINRAAAMASMAGV